MKVWLCEKPDQGRSLAPMLGCFDRKDGYIAGDNSAVTWCFGHLFQQFNPDDYDPALKQWKIENLPIKPDEWKLKPEKGKTKQIGVINKLLKQASSVVIATDPGREGEMIAREVLDEAGFTGSIERLWLNAQDKDSIKKALANLRPGQSSVGLYYSALARSRADWLVGLNMTRLYTLLARDAGNEGVWSVGRVQTPTLKLIVDRDAAIAKFKPSPFWQVYASGEKEEPFKFTWSPTDGLDDSGRCVNQQRAEQLAAAVKSLNIISSSQEQKKQPHPLGYSLSDLQKEMNRRYGFGIKKTLDLAQSLYETHKLTTYPRADGRYLPLSQHGDASVILGNIKACFNDMAAYVVKADSEQKSRIWNDKQADKSEHHAIIPTKLNADIPKLKKDEYLVYEAICKRYLQQFLPDHIYMASKIEAVGASEPFVLTGKAVKQAGWKDLESHKTEDDEEKSIPLFTEGEQVEVVAECQRKMTKPPAHYTEASLLDDMINIGKFIEDDRLKKIMRETTGLGTEATRADIVETLIKREYIKLSKKKMLATAKGNELIRLVDDKLSDPGTTATWEQYLDDIASGQGTLEDFSAGQERWLNAMFKRIKENPPDVQKAETAKYFCPDCGKPLRKRRGDKPWWGCTGYSEGCQYTAPDARGKPAKPKQKFPCGCGKGGDFIERGKGDNKFFGCNKYPDCKETRSWVKGKPGEPQKKADQFEAVKVDDQCPKCLDGKIVSKTMKNGKNAGKQFYACSIYECDFFQWVKS